MRKNRSSSNRGFSLMEIVVALAVAMLILGGATLMIGSVNEEHRLRKAAGSIETIARATLLDAVSSQRSRVLMINQGSIENPENGKSIEVPQLEFAVDSKWRTPKNVPWRFMSSGFCEPISLRVTAETGSIEMRFDPLTGEVAEESVTILK